MNDTELLRKFAESGAEDAFGELVTRHINFVYSVARRNISDTHLAEEVVQTVFIILARKAASLTGLRSLTAWLQRTTRLAALEALRRDCRRRDREEKFGQMDHTDTEPIWEQIAPHLDELMLQLGETDRLVLALRFFESKSFQDVGHALGTGEDAARMRVNRALEKLRGLFARRGVVVPASALLVAVSTHSVQAAPVGLAASVATTTLAQGSALKTPALVKGTLKLMAWTKVKIAVVVGMSLLLAAGTATVAVVAIEDHAAAGRTQTGDYQWQVEKLTQDRNTLDMAPPQVTILPTKFPGNGGRVRVGGRGTRKIGGLDVPLSAILDFAYDPNIMYVDSGPYRDGQIPARMVLLTALPQDRYDFIASLPRDSAKALQHAIKDKFGVAVTTEMRDTPVLLLTVNRPNAPGLKPSGLSPNAGGSMKYSGQGRSWTNASLRELAAFLEDCLNFPVIDKTGLKQGYKLDLEWGGTRQNLDSDKLKQAVLDQLGLELVPTNMPVKMLVVEKADN
jgi:RNA polymerase sigma factor (sigma-70 family)